MKKLGILMCVAALGLVAGCKSESKGSMGAVGEQKKSDCCASDKSATCTEKKADGSMGAVSEQKKSGCCSSKSQSN